MTPDDDFCVYVLRHEARRLSWDAAIRARPLPREKPMTKATNPYAELSTILAKVNRRKAELEAASAYVPPPEPDAATVTRWTAALPLESAAAATVRARLHTYFDSHGTGAEFCVRGTWLDGMTCARRLRQGDTLKDYLAAESTGRFLTKRERDERQRYRQRTGAGR